MLEFGRDYFNSKNSEKLLVINQVIDQDIFQLSFVDNKADILIFSWVPVFSGLILPVPVAFQQCWVGWLLRFVTTEIYHFPFYFSL